MPDKGKPTESNLVSSDSYGHILPRHSRLLPPIRLSANFRRQILCRIYQIPTGASSNTLVSLDTPLIDNTVLQNWYTDHTGRMHFSARSSLKRVTLLPAADWWTHPVKYDAHRTTATAYPGISFLSSSVKHGLSI